MNPDKDPHNPKALQSLLDVKRAERLSLIIDELIEANHHAPVIVEGKKDRLALRQLGLTGEVLTLHSGKGFYEFTELVLDSYRQVILLLDWDRAGERMQIRLSGALEGFCGEYAHIREELKALCVKDINDIEGLPALMRRLKSSIALSPTEERQALRERSHMSPEELGLD